MNISEFRGNVTTDVEHKNFLKQLAKDHHVEKKVDWNSYNGGHYKKAYVIDCENLEKGPADIISRIYKYNMISGRAPVLCIPVAGWDPLKYVKNLKIDKSYAKKQLDQEYAHSFSLSNMTTTGSGPVDFILRAGVNTHEVKTFERDGKYYARISAGMTIEEVDKILFGQELAFFPNNPTIQKISGSGAAANGCYGPDGENGPISTKIIDIRVVDPFGNHLTLSATENQDLFRVLRDCHMGTCFYVKDFLIEVEKKFLIKHHHVVYKDVPELQKAMMLENPINQEHFIAMYIPVENGIRISTFARTEERPEKILTRDQKDCKDFTSLILTESGEPLIELIANSESLRQFFPLVLKSAALKTYGLEKDTSYIDWSDSIHIFGTYTDVPIYDINWLIQVDSRDDARKITLDLLALSEKILKQEGDRKHFPLLNAFVRYTKGVSDPTGEGGIAPTTVDKDSQGVIAFEFVTYASLSKTESFKKLVNEVIAYLKTQSRKFTYHYPKHMPDDINSVTQLLTDDLGKKRLQNFQKAVCDIHGGENNIQYSPFLTLDKKRFIGLAHENLPKPDKKKIIGLASTNILKTDEEKSTKHITKEQEQQALEKIIELAIEEGDFKLVNEAKVLRSLI